VTWNATHKAYPDDASVHELFEQQVKRTPDAVALVCEDQQRSYDELNRAANQLARHLRNLGAGPEVLVSICLERSVDLLTGVYGILKAGAAYVPLDPAYPADRLALMLEDAQCGADVRSAPPLSPHREDRVHRHRLGEHRAEAEDNLDTGVTGRNVSYVIYTSGSTGRPKGVMVEHRNVTNFFAGMDDCIPHTPPGTWLAVTSLSFDISVLELFWTLARGFTVILDGGSGKGTRAAGIEFQPVLFRQRRRRERRRQVRPSARRGQVRRPEWLRRGLDTGTALWCVWRIVSEPSVTSAALASIHEIDRPSRG
jgi:non-ribosomal peptide synthetase component F